MEKSPRILVFSTEKISDPAIDLAGLLKLHYPPTVYTVTVPCSSGIKPRWIMHAFEQGFDGVFIAADGEECAFTAKCPELTNQIVVEAQKQMKEKNINQKRIRMAAICSVCAEPFANHMNNFAKLLSELDS